MHKLYVVHARRTTTAQDVSLKLYPKSQSLVYVGIISWLKLRETVIMSREIVITN
jgi:hypothetical protein